MENLELNYIISQKFLYIIKALSNVLNRYSLTVVSQENDIDTMYNFKPKKLRFYLKRNHH